MSNYLNTLDEEIARLRIRMDELETTRRVLMTLQEPVLKAAEKRVQKRTPSKHKPAGARGTVYQKTRNAIVKVMDSMGAPVHARDIIAMLKDHVAVGDSTVWKSLKDLRDEGLITWDTETRLYSRVQTKREVA